MKQLEEILPPGRFVRIHKSYIVSLAHVKMIKADQVLLGKDEALPLSPNHRERLLELFKE